MESVSSDQSEIIVKKERETEYERKTQNERKDGRSKFFTQQIQSKLSQAKIMEEKQEQIISLFMDEQWALAIHRQCVAQLKQILTQIEKIYKRKRRECLPMQRIIKNNFENLTVICIEYRQKCEWSHQYRYSVSAFELFRVVHRNKRLRQVTLRGVKVQQFEEFTSILNRGTHNKPIEQEETKELSWMRKLSLKSLKLSINATVKFEIQKKDRTLSQMDDLAYFRSLFCQLSDIIAEVRLGFWIQINEWNQILQKLWECLGRIKNISLELWGNSIITQQASIVRSVLFGGLASFKEITHLSFRQIRFHHSVGINDFLSIEQSLSTFFKNNAITHLELHNCSNFPVFPAATLELVHLSNVTFRKQSGFMRQVARRNSSLSSIKCLKMRQEWRINEELFDQLQTLVINNCNRISFGDFSSGSPSNIKHLRVYISGIWKIDSLPAIFPKLYNLIQLILSGINFGDEVICTIPSPNLEELHLYDIREKIDLRVIDAKWPNLRSITIWECSEVTKNFWRICEFKGLMQLHIDEKLWRKENFQELKRRGIALAYS